MRVTGERSEVGRLWWRRLKVMRIETEETGNSFSAVEEECCIGTFGLSEKDKTMTECSGCTIEKCFPREEVVRRSETKHNWETENC